MRILMTGGTGLIGRAYVRRLLAAGFGFRFPDLPAALTDLT